MSSGSISRSYSKKTNSFPHGLDNSYILQKMSQSTKTMGQKGVLSELLKSRERLDRALTLTRTPREVRANYGNGITTSNFIPRGQYQPYENNHGSVVSSVVSEIVPKRSNHNLGSIRGTYKNSYDDVDGDFNIERGPRNGYELGPGHGTLVKTWDQYLDEDYYLKVIPLKKQ
ncbi:unnamed protein product [Arctia plantaginis]|uniref:Uncharacterized protein n=1 Tax=Arctia plantaginis TaxID=874455 RepID=A0A8S1AFR3_ARCPL|nr:unnamed protein product [Arctia plantaginis]